MKYLQQFRFPTLEREDRFMIGRIAYKSDMKCYRNYYPYRVLSAIDLSSLDLSEITILYGGNGSGKSTVINVIAEPSV